MAVCLTEAYIVWHKQFKSIDFFLNDKNSGKSIACKLLCLLCFKLALCDFTVKCNGKGDVV